MITISPGHWTVGTGASDLIDEVTEARKVAKEVTKILRASGIVTNYIEDNTSKTKAQNLTYLVTQHNKTSRKLDVSIHFNSSSGRQSKGIGTEVLYYDEKGLAAKVSKAIANASGLIDRGAKQRKELAILASTNKPAILIEVCFVNSAVDVAVYRRAFNKICSAIADELAKHVGKSLKGSEEELVFSSPTLREVVEKLMKDKKAQKEFIQKGIAAKAFNKSWLEKFNKGELEEHDIIGLHVIYAQAK